MLELMPVVARVQAQIITAAVAAVLVIRVRPLVAAVLVLAAAAEAGKVPVVAAVISAVTVAHSIRLLSSQARLLRVPMVFPWVPWVVTVVLAAMVTTTLLIIPAWAVVLVAVVLALGIMSLPRAEMVSMQLVHQLVQVAPAVQAVPSFCLQFTVIH